MRRRQRRKLLKRAFLGQHAGLLRVLKRQFPLVPGERAIWVDCSEHPGTCWLQVVQVSGTSAEVILEKDPPLPGESWFLPESRVLSIRALEVLR